MQRFRVANGDWRALRVALEATAYDGATNLGAFVPDNEVGEVLLFSDGLTNYGEEPFHATRVPVYAVSAAVSADAARLRNAAPENLYRVYLDERPDYLNSTAFFLDAADIFFDKGETALALRVLSNLAEMDLGSRHILRVLGQRLLQAGEAKLAIPVFRKVAELSPEEPQSGRDLGLAYAADRRFQKATDTLYEVVIRPWHGRFPEVELITLAELNAIVTTAGVPLDTGRIDPRLLKNLPLDVRVVLTWDADNTDIDLWVTDPNGEKAFYGNRFTY